MVRPGLFFNVRVALCRSVQSYRSPGVELTFAYVVGVDISTPPDWEVAVYEQSVYEESCRPSNGRDALLGQPSSFTTQIIENST
jgi:hypothetical protein